MLDPYLRWLTEVELAGRPDAARVASELGDVVRRIADAAGDVRGRRALDIGTGTGAVAAGLRERGARVVGVDLDVAALARGPARPAVAGDARALPFADGTFAATVHRSVLVHLDDRGRAVAEERRVLGPRGRVSASESLGADLELRARDPGIVRVWEAGLRQILREAARAPLDAEGLSSLYRDAGFDAVRVETEVRPAPLDSPAAIVRAFTARPPAGDAAADAWRSAGVPAALVDEFLARLAAEAERGTPPALLVVEGYLTARAG